MLGFDAGTNGFVFNEFLQLTERPTTDHAIQMLVSDLGSRANTTELFQSDRAALVHLRFANENLGQHVILMLDVTRFTTRKSLQNTTRPACPFTLQAGANIRALGFVLLTGLPIMQGAVIGCRRITNAAIDAHRVIAGRLGVDIFNHDINAVSISRAREHSSRRFLATQRLPLIFAKHKRHVNAPTNHGQGYGFVGFTKGKDARVVINTGRAEHTRFTAVSLGSRHGRAYSADRSYSEVCRQAVADSNISVTSVMQFDVVRDTIAHGNRQRVVAGIRKRIAGCRQLLGHCRRWLNFAFYSSLRHSDNNITSALWIQPKGGFPPPPEGGGFQPRIL